jgi:SAM-dependent methyltransferase
VQLFGAGDREAIGAPRKPYNEKRPRGEIAGIPGKCRGSLIANRRAKEAGSRGRRSISRVSSRTPWSGHALYTKAFLSAYDWFALGFHCRFVWQCPPSHVLELYDQHISRNHLDIGVGTGYFLDKCRFPTEHPRLVLVDINPNSLAVAQKRLKRYHPQVHRRDILEPLCIDTPGFDSIGLSHLLHCLPGTMDTKGTVFQNIMPLLNPGGVVFGTTFLYEGIKSNPLAKYMFWWTNLLGFMTNKQDSMDGLAQNLRRYFSESHIESRGCGALFWALK